MEMGWWNVLRAVLCLVSMQVPVAGRAGEAAQPLRVAAAADLKFALDEILSKYHQVRPGVEVSSVFGSSGRFYALLANGAPFDVYLSAEWNTPGG